MKQLSFLSLLFTVLAFSCNRKQEKNMYTDYVDPFIGTDYHGHVFLGANIPFGAVQVGPTNFVKGWDWCSGYHYSDSIVTGFSQTHLSGTGIGDLGDVSIMPYTGEIKPNPGTQNDISAGHASFFSHLEETAEPGYYSVKLLSTGIQAEMTATARVGFHRYTYPAGNRAQVIINLKDGIGWDKPLQTSIKQVNESTFTGFRHSTGWAKDQRCFFAVKISKPAVKVTIFENDSLLSGNEATGKAIRANLSFNNNENESILIKVGISPVSEKNALENIEAEITDWEFQKVRDMAKIAWNNELSKIKVKSKNITDLRKFYTSLYHTMIAPVLFNDHNGEYFGADKQVHGNPGFQNYSVFSLWDTYRAAHPLYTIIQPERVNDFVKTMLAISDQQGTLPVWHLMGNETGTMVGYHAVPVIVDAYHKRLGDFDVNHAYEAIKRTSVTEDGDGSQWIIKNEFLPADSVGQSVSKAEEYAVDDWCIAQMAKELKKDSDFIVYMKRAGYYKHYYDPATGFMRGKNLNGTWNEPFHPVFTLHESGNYTEGNAWQYLWMVPHDVEGLIGLIGGEEKFVTRLDSLFLINSALNEGASSDISGLIGQYAHGNEPGHHTTYLFSYAGQQWKTAEKVRFICNNLYTDQPDGLCGNEDCGQMSAWYVFSALGFYPVNPANSMYVFGSPLFDEVTIDVGKGNQFTVKTVNNSPENIYIQSVKLNGQPYEKSYITHSSIIQGGVLEFEMGKQPNRNFGALPENRPESKMYN